MDEEVVELYEKSGVLADRILAKLGELHLKALYNVPNPNQIFHPVVDPRTEISNVIAGFLMEQPDG